MKKSLKNISMFAFAGSAVLSISGCAAISTVMHHGHLRTESKMSHTIFLDPVSDHNKTIYVQVRDTSGKGVHLKGALVAELKNAGWKVVHNFKNAHDMIQVNVRQVGKARNMNAVWQSMNAGYGSSLLGGLAGVTAAYATNSIAAGGAVGFGVGAASWLIDQMYTDVTYSMITDIQVSVKVKGEVHQTTNSELSQGTQSVTSQSYSTHSHWLRYKTRIASVADKVNLKFEEAKPELVNGVSKQIAGIFA